jgi:CheY-like chemotaxis protein
VRRKGIPVPRILVADDNTNIQKMVTLAFQERGVEVIAVGNGEAAVRRIPDANPDLVLADVFMPVRNGYEVCEFVKKDSRFAHTPVILLVGAFDPLDEKEARRVGADGVLKKPFVPPDPLIAMVMSALEKNPRVMAEMAKAKEVAAAPPPPVALENPATAEPKPLPHFPEPTAEEAAIIYGFGKGVRGMDSDEDVEEEKTKSAPAPKAVTEKSGPKVASGPKTSLSVVGADDDEEFDEVSTATDRRRASTDFEVPDNVSADPTYSYGRDFEPITFPSEKDVPPKHVKETTSQAQPVASESGIAKAAVVETDSQAPLEDAPESSDWDIRPESESKSTISANGTSPSGLEIQTEAPVELVSGEIEQEAAAAPFSLSSRSASSKEQETEVAIKGLPQRVFEASREAAPVAQSDASASATPAKTRESAVHEAPPARERGWMDMIESSAASAESHWTTNLESETIATSSHAIDGTPEQVESTSHTSEIGSEAATETAAIASPESHRSSSSEPRVTHASANSSETETAAIEAPASEVWTDELAALPSLNLGGQFDSEPRSFGESTPQFGSSSYHFATPADSEQQDHLASIDKTETAPVIENASPELLAAPADLSRNNDEESHAPSEPLFVTEEAGESSDYASRPEDSQPTEHLAETNAESTFSDRLDTTEHLLEAAPTSFFANSGEPAPSEEFSERIPTLPPANREALSDIAFLMPPPGTTEILPATIEESRRSTDVDDVVRKVLEKLQPQLQEMLSQGMKPLLESLVQNELQKKDK